MQRVEGLDKLSTAADRTFFDVVNLSHFSDLDPVHGDFQIGSGVAASKIIRSSAMKAQIESLSPVKTRISIEIDQEEVAREEANALAALRRRASIPGFRKGKVPANLLKKRFADQLSSDVQSNLIKRTYGEALRQESIVPISNADIQINSSAEGGGFSYTAVVEVPPSVEPKGYSGLDLQRDKVLVDDLEIEKELEAAQKEHTTYEPATEDRKAASGDRVNIDYVGTIDGEFFDGGSSEGADIDIGSGRALKEIEEGLVGSGVGDSLDIEATIPAGVPIEKIAGKTASFKIKVNSVKIPKVPELNDEFAKEISPAETLEDLRVKIRDLLAAQKENASKKKFVAALQGAILNANPFEVPQCLVSEELEFRINNLKNNAGRQGMNPDALGLDDPALLNAQRVAAEKAVRWAYLVQAIAKVEDLTISDEELNETIQKISDAEGKPVSQIRSALSADGRLESIRRSLLEQKVLDLVEKSSTVTEAEPSNSAKGDASDD